MTSLAPRASIVIATYNRADRLSTCLAALADQSQPAADFEVVVVVDGSTNATVAVLDAYSPPYSLKAITQPNQGQSIALNRGAAEARGDLLIFLDDDILAFPNFVAEHLALCARDPHAVGVGQMLLELGPQADWFAQAFGDAWRKHYDRLNAAPEAVSWRDCYGGNMSVLRQRFLQVGGFATDLARGYDVELAARLAASGCRFVYLPDALGLQDERKGAAALLRDAELGGAGSVAIYRRHPEALSLIGHFPEQTLQSALVLRALLAFDLDPAALARLLGWAPLVGKGRLAFDLLHRYAFWRGVRRALGAGDAWDGLSTGAVVLMYHGFCLAGERPGRYLIAPATFALQMGLLRRLGCAVMDLSEYVDLVRSRALPRGRTVVVTIDDGYAETATQAVPALLRFGIPATVFLPTGRVGGANDWDPGSELYRRPLLSWAGARALHSLGVRLGAHSRAHRPLTQLEPAELRDELGAARAEFARQIGEPPALMSYPYGDFGPEVEAAAAAAGYAGAVTVEPGANTPLTGPYALRRVEIRGNDSLLAFVYAVLTGRELRAAGRRLRLVLARVLTRPFERRHIRPSPVASSRAALREND